jgi:hypothetical protein
MKSLYPNIKQSIFLLLSIIVLMLLFGILISIISLGMGNKFADSPLVVVIVNSLAIGIFLFRSKFKTGLPYTEIFPLKKFPVIILLPILIGTLGLSIVFSEFDNLFRLALPMPDSIIKIFTNLAFNSDFLSSLLALSVVAPLTEEFLFRGYILQSFLKQYSVKKSVLVSSFLFALLHLNPWQFTSAFCLGIIFSLLFIKYKSLIPSLIAHSVFNSIPSVMKFFNIHVSGFTEIKSFQPIWFDILGIVLVGIGYMAFSIITKQRTIQEE